MRIRIIPFLFGLFLTNMSWAQKWFPDGASWYYNQIVPGWGESYRYFEVTGDTIIQGKSCKVIDGSCSCGYGFGYVYQEDDKVLSFDFEADSFELLYDFNLVAGDTLILEGGPLLAEDGMFLIDSITYIQVGSLNLRVQHITQLGIHMVLGDQIIERIGSDGCLYPQPGSCIPPTGPLRCYADMETGLINFQPEVQCDQSYITSTSMQDGFIRVSVYPNPTNGMLYIECDHVIKKVELFNNFSIQPIHHLNYFNTKAELNTEALPSGIFYLRVTTDDGIFLRLVVLQK